MMNFSIKRNKFCFLCLLVIYSVCLFIFTKPTIITQKECPNDINKFTTIKRKTDFDLSDYLNNSVTTFQQEFDFQTGNF